MTVMYIFYPFRSLLSSRHIAQKFTADERRYNNIENEICAKNRVREKLKCQEEINKYEEV